MGLDRSPEQLIKAGLTALKQKDYGRAIATFQQLIQTDNINNSYRLKAQMGLIRTYETQGANAQAQSLCKPLLKSRSQAIRQWAHDKLQQLEAEPAQSKNSDSRPHLVPASSFSDTSGFVPFNPNESNTDPIPSQETAVSSAEVNESLASKVTSKVPIETQTYSTTETASSDGPSLFHYETLNSKRGLGIRDIAESSNINNSPISPLAAQSSHPSKHPDQQHSSNKQQNSLPKRVSSKSSTEGPEAWPQGSRLSTVKSLGKVSMGQLWFTQLTTIAFLFWVVHWLLKTTLTLIRNYLQFLDQLLPINIRPAAFFWNTQIWTVLIGLGLLTIVAPWLWSFLLQPSHQIPSQQLQIYSPEVVQLLHRLCAKRRWKFPTIQQIDSELPIIFSYGWRPRYGQLVVSQGLFKHLEPDELAAIIMYEISHWSTLDWIFFSTQGLLLQGFHRAYWFFARQGKERPALIKIAAGTLATLSYCIFWLFARLGYGLARTRTPYRDRIAVELTGNPNGLVRALAKLSNTIADEISQQGYTPPLLESLESMLPVGLEESGISVQQYAWGAFNPLRHWLSINQAHPPLGDRLYTLGAYGRHWRLKPSLNFAHLQLKHGARTLSVNDWQDLLLQGGAWSGLILGLGIAVIMWLIGAIATSLDYPLLAWLYKDRSILIGIPLICLATGQLLRVNLFFPDITNERPTTESQLATWKTDSTLIPIKNRPATINGTLTGRPALANWLGQEWRLRIPQGSIRLHHVTYLGPLGNIRGLAAWLQQPIQVTGWFRRGHHPWIDIEHLRTHHNQIQFAQHPIWAAITSVLPLSYGLWIIFRGG
ncbi:MAG: zinc metalloprotease HtpX [Cyanobacteria bacterium P01_H01_bin.105]